ncbi:NADH-ubiquinone oxidoreductase chain 5-like [Vespa mandarinia]|uniref:NADH-ubiquinone oxidoreductase chain 5-like n=1 Tax=Vespa mandarinia TaxID=7446 RepID=UPI00160A7B33|nr:NADH-ubiquinone oxidoreductase chain 5-like [Vespa mandarinia]
MSTLVTAGVYLLIRYKIRNHLISLILFISRSTIIISGLIANFENDLKKIIALSTLRQLGLIMRILRLGEVDLGFIHLLIHALFKSLLFICRGVLIHQINNNQDIRFIGRLVRYYPFVRLVFFVSLLSLCGFPFFSGYYSKDLIIEVFLIRKINIVRILILLVSTIFTVSYSIRLIIIVYLSYINKINYFILLGERAIIRVSLIILYFYSLIIGYFYINLINFTLIILNLFEKLIVIQICLVGCILG